MKRVRKKFSASGYILMALLVVALLGIGSTMAWFTDTETAQNTVTIGHSTVEIEETVDGLTKTNIGIKNTGSVPVYVRMRVDVPSGITYLTADNEEKTVSVIYNPVSPVSWTKGDDGYWYYDKILKPGETAELYESVALNAEGITDEQMEQLKGLLDITVYGESVQSDNLPEHVTTAKAAFDYLAQQPGL